MTKIKKYYNKVILYLYYSPESTVVGGLPTASWTFTEKHVTGVTTGVTQKGGG